MYVSTYKYRISGALGRIDDLRWKVEGYFFETHTEYQANHSNHLFVVGWDKLSLWSPPGKEAPPPGGYSDYPYSGCSTKNQVLRLALDFLFFFGNKLKKSICFNLVSVATCPTMV